MRVIEPLVAILAMVGVTDSPEATLVGRPCEGCALRSPIRIHMIVESEGGLNPLSQEFLLVDDLMDLAYAASARNGGPRWSP
jgi:hypothetical protein